MEMARDREIACPTCKVGIRVRQPPGFCKILIDSSKTSEDFQEK
jgi:hypothetical protein